MSKRVSKQAIFSETETKILRLIRNNPKAVGRAMVALYKRQTPDEQRAGVTIHTNGIGFNAIDAHKGSYYAKWVLAGKQLDGHHLTDAQDLARKYLAQLVDIAENNTAAKDLEARECAKFN